ncbi:MULTISPECIES: hypothetical protein [unclassified Pseudomonas]|nr:MULTISPECIES: hypothetical protein [unclassified Pseudomonas]MPQ70600.1 hypothetical protein [Pseudomonas sp. MWU12-2323]
MHTRQDSRSVMGFFCDRVRARKNPRTWSAAVKNNDRRRNPGLPRPTRGFRLSYTNYAQIYPQAVHCNHPPKRIILYLGSKKTQHVGFSPKIPNHISRQELKLFSCIRGVELNTDLKAQTAYADGSRSSFLRGKTVRVLQDKTVTHQEYRFGSATRSVANFGKEAAPESPLPLSRSGYARHRSVVVLQDRTVGTFMVPKQT